MRALAAGAALLLWWAPVEAHPVPESCAALAARERAELPRTDAEARAALALVRRKAVRGDVLALSCWLAVVKLRAESRTTKNN